jgi:hypothetical protein
VGSKPIDRYQVLDPVKFRIAGHDDGVQAYRRSYGKSIRIGNRGKGVTFAASRT